MSSPVSPQSVDALADDTLVDLYPLHVSDGEDGEHEVGRTDTGVFIALPAAGVALIELLSAGLAAGEVRRRFAERFGEPPDLADFVAGLGSCGFVRSVDGRAYAADGAEPTDAAAGPDRPRGVQLFANLPARRVRWLLSRPMRLFYLAVWLAVPALLLAVPRLRPVPSDALLIERVFVNALIVAAVAWGLVLLHEGAHALTVRALDCVGRLSLSRRLWFLVAQTEMTGVRSLPRRRRYAPYLAGMTWDLFLFLGCLGAQLAGVGGQVARTVAYLLTVSLIFQLSVFMRTDMYFVVANRLRVANLMRDTRRFLTAAVRRLLARPATDDLADIPGRELRIIRWYAPVYVVGSAAALAVYALLIVPSTVLMVRLAVDALGGGPAQAAFWDATGFLLLVAVHLVALGWIVVAERRRPA